MIGSLTIVSGPSGVGKDSVIDLWRAWNPRVERVVACTTRPPRPGEVDGMHYHFLDPDTFASKAMAGEFLEWKQVHQYAYATPTETVDRLLGEGRITVLKIDVQGALSVMAQRKDCLSVFLMPPSHEELERRILGRATESPEALRIRLENAIQEMEQRWHYQYIAVNDALEDCVRRIELYVAQAEDREPVTASA